MRAYITVLDGESDLVPYFVKYYRRLGADTFPVLVYSDVEGELLRVMNLVQESGGEPLSIGQYPSSIFSAARRDQLLRDFHPEGLWSFFCDLDEFADITPQEVRRVINTNPRYIMGTWIDRVAPGGKLQPINPREPLEKTYPYGCEVRKQLKAGDMVYVLSPRGPDLHHPNACGWGRNFLDEVPRIRVHHFKWQTNVIPRLQRRLQRIEALKSTERRKQWYERVQRTLQYLDTYEGVDTSKMWYIGQHLGI